MLTFGYYFRYLEWYKTTRCTEL